jgi:drug/metabolite transporter (DMT)-like permease
MLAKTKALLEKNDLTVAACFLFLMLAWGSSFILVKRGLEVFAPMQVASIRLSSAMIAMLGFSIPQLRHIPRRQLPYIFLSSILGLFVPAFLFSYAQTGLNSSLAGVINALTPCMTFIVGLSFFGQAATWTKVVGLVLGFAGTASLILTNAKGALSLNYYAFYVVAATVLYGFNLNIVKRFLPDVRAWHLSTASVLMVGTISLAYLLTTDWLTVLQTTPKAPSAFMAVVALGLLGTAIAQTVFNYLLQMTSAVVASSITYLVPIVAVLWGVWDGEILTAWHFFGMTLILGGVVILNRK